MSAEIYVGKNVSITLQTPVEEEIPDQLADLHDFVGIDNPSSTHVSNNPINLNYAFYTFQQPFQNVVGLLTLSHPISTADIVRDEYVKASMNSSSW